MQHVVYRIDNGRFDGIILKDSDLTSLNCNFFKKGKYDGFEARAAGNDVPFDFYQSYLWVPEPNCAKDLQSIVSIRKSVKSIIQSDAPGYARYQTPQKFQHMTDAIVEKGMLTNILYEGLYAGRRSNDIILHTRNRMYNPDGTKILDENNDPIVNEQPDRTDNPHSVYSRKDKCQIINDRERIHNYDRIPLVYDGNGINNTFTAVKTTNNVLLPQIMSYRSDEHGYAPEGRLAEQRRLTFSSAGVLYILDSELGLNGYNSFGELL
jgi:hypothetical protein